MQINTSLGPLVLTVILLSTTVEPASRYLIPFVNTESFDYSLDSPNAPSNSSKTVSNFRLPNETYPEHYDIKLTTHVHNGTKLFQGEVTIDIVVVKATSSIVLHARQLKFSKASITSLSTGEKEELSYKYEVEREFLTLARKNGKQFGSDSNWKLTIIYNGKLREDNRGFYISKFIDDNGNYRYLAATQFESTDARHAFPCYDEPNKVANFTITIIHSTTYKAISNMPVNETLSSSGKTVFLTTARMPSYIVAFVVSDFENTVGILDGLPQQIYSRGSAKHTHDWALISSMLITQRLSKYYGVDFMLSKMDHVAIPDNEFNGMENWGLAIYAEENLLYDEHNSDIFTKTKIANTLAHEIAHQWFGDLVTIKWWTYLWLKESFATLFSYRALADIYPDWDIWQSFHVTVYQNALKDGALNEARPMTYYVQKPEEISSLYDTVVFSTAASVLYMWGNALTDTVFQRGLHNYLTVNQYTAAAEEELFTAIQNAAKEENYKIPAKIEELIGCWSHQGGYPLLTVTRNYEKGTFTVKQEAFHKDETFKDNKTWHVPINYVVASKPDFRDTEATHYLLKASEMNINAEAPKGDWLLLNKQSAYYYRIKYDEKNYELITDSLIKQPFKFHVRNRAQLMLDAFEFSVSNRIDHGLLLKMMTYLKKEDQYAPWSVAGSIIRTFYIYLNDDQNYNDLKVFIADLIEPIYKKLGIHDVSGEHFQKYTRREIIDLACLFDVEDCLQETNNKLQDLVKQNIAIEPNLQSVIYCNGLKQSTDADFEFFYKQLMDSTDKKLRSLLISSLGCSQNENHINKFIYSSIDRTNKLRTEERYNLLYPVYSRSGVGLLACIDFLNENLDEYENLGGAKGFELLNNDILKMAHFVINKKQEEKYLALVAKIKVSEHGTPDLENSVEAIITENFKWIKKNRAPLMIWISQYHTDKLLNGSVGLTISAVLITLSFMSTIIPWF